MVESIYQDAYNHLKEMVNLSNILISESVNENDPIEDVQRTLSKEDFLTYYKSHSSELCNILDNLKKEDYENVDDQLSEAKKDLSSQVEILKKKYEKLNELRFWLDNSVIN